MKTCSAVWLARCVYLHVLYEAMESHRWLAFWEVVRDSNVQPEGAAYHCSRHARFRAYS